MAAKRTTSKAPTVRRKPAAKKSSTSVVQSAVVSHTPKIPSSPASTTPSNMRLKRPYVIGAVVIVLLGFLAYTFRGVFIVATVNGTPISRLSVVRELERQGGKQIVTDMIARILISQEAKRRGIELTQKEIDTDLAKMEADYKSKGQTLDQVLKFYGITKAEVIERRKPTLLLEKMVGKDIVVSDKEVQDFIAKNNEAYGGTLKPDQVKKDLASEKLQQKQQELIQKLQKDAKINNIVTY